MIFPFSPSVHPHIINETEPPAPTRGERCADYIAEKVGSWLFINTMSVILACWIFWNTGHVPFGTQFDPPPYIGLNLLLSFLAAYTGPILLIAANRTAQRDRSTILMFKKEFEVMADDHATMHAEHKEMHEETKLIQTELLELLRQSRKSDLPNPTIAE